MACLGRLRFALDDNLTGLRGTVIAITIIMRINKFKEMWLLLGALGDDLLQPHGRFMLNLPLNERVQYQRVLLFDELVALLEASR